MDQETLNRIKKEYTPRLVTLEPRVALAAILYSHEKNKREMAMIESLYADINRKMEQYEEQSKEWNKTNKKLEKHKTRNVKIEKMFDKQF